MRAIVLGPKDSMQSEEGEGPRGTPSFGINREKEELQRELRAIRRVGGNEGRFFKEGEANGIRGQKGIKQHKE